MKRLLLICFTFCITIQMQSQTLYKSKFGYSTDPSGIYRVLIIFAEIDYTGTCDPDPYTYNPEWIVGELPAFKDDIIDIEELTNPVNYISKYFHEMSFGNLSLIGDYYPEIVTINCADALTGSYGGTSNVTDYLDNLAGAIVTENGYVLSDFDDATSADDYPNWEHDDLPDWAKGNYNDVFDIDDSQILAKPKNILTLH